MGDRIKQYRVWCPTLREMLYDFKVEQEFWHPGSANQSTAIVKVYTSWGTPMQPPYIFMESVGLNDKNERVIFDGDIVSDPGNNLNQVEFIVIQHDNDGIGWNGYKVKNIDHCEVVGNIFENSSMMRAPLPRDNPNAQPMTTLTQNRRPQRAPRISLAMDNNHTGEQFVGISQHITDSIRLADQAQRRMIIDRCNSLQPGQSYTTRDSNQIREIMRHDWGDEFTWEHNPITAAIIITRRQDPQPPRPQLDEHGGTYYLPTNMDQFRTTDENLIGRIMQNTVPFYNYTLNTNSHGIELTIERNAETPF